MGAVLSVVCQWITSFLESFSSPRYSGPLDVKTIGEEVCIFHASCRVAHEDFTTVLRLPDSLPARFVLCIERYASLEAGAPAEHCEVQFTGTLITEQDRSLQFKCAHVAIANALNDLSSKEFIECRERFTATRDWEAIRINLSTLQQRDHLPPWLFSDSVPLTLVQHR